MRFLWSAVIALLFTSAEAAFAHHWPVKTEKEACQAVINRAIVAFKLGPPAQPWCETGQTDPTFFVVGLEAGLPCPDHQQTCSGLVGWFGVRKSTGRVIHWDVAQDRPSKPL